MVVDANDKAVTGRENRDLALLTVEATANGLRVGANGSSPFDVSLPDDTTSLDRRQIRLWNDDIIACDLGDAIAEKMSMTLDTPVRLVYMDAGVEREIEPSFEREGSAQVSFADTYPLLVINEASVIAQSELAGETLDARRFRANIEITGSPAWDEDYWYKVRIGRVDFNVAGPCERCSFTTVDPDTGQTHPDQQPLRSLARNRRNTNGEVCFGQHLVANVTGKINVGDPVEILERGEARPLLRQPTP